MQEMPDSVAHAADPATAWLRREDIPTLLKMEFEGGSRTEISF